MIKVKELSKYFGESLAVDKLSFEVELGEILGFLGPNGAGKTTTMRMITGFFPPSSGSIAIDGIDPFDEPLKARSKIGYLPEHTPVYPEMRIGEYLYFVGQAKGLNKFQIKKQTAKLLALLGLEKRKGQLIKQLSKGFRQRVGLAQALMADPPILILDEPSIGLDPGQIVEIRELIKSFRKVKTVILSSHILPEIKAACTRVLILNQGRLMATGPLDTLSASNTELATYRLICLGEKQALASSLKQIEGVVKARPFEQKAPENGNCAFTIELKGGAKTRARLTRYLVNANLDPVELSPVNESLEEIFMQLTQKDQAIGQVKP